MRQQDVYLAGVPRRFVVRPLVDPYPQIRALQRRQQPVPLMLEPVEHQGVLAVKLLHHLQDGGHHAIWYGYPNWNLELYQQANKRLHRQGQPYPVISHLLVVQDGMDEDVVSALGAKGDAQDALMRALKARIENARRNLV